MGVRLFRLKPRYAGEVLVDEDGVRFRGGTLTDWGLSWKDPTFRITFIVRGEGEGDHGKGTLPTVALAKPGTSLLTPEAYRAIVTKASELGLRVETLSRSNRGWGRTVIRRF